MHFLCMALGEQGNGLETEKGPRAKQRSAIIISHQQQPGAVRVSLWITAAPPPAARPPGFREEEKKNAPRHTATEKPATRINQRGIGSAPVAYMTSAWTGLYWYPAAIDYFMLLPAMADTRETEHTAQGPVVSLWNGLFHLADFHLLYFSFQRNAIIGLYCKCGA